jgi:CBS domain-containing protein
MLGYFMPRHRATNIAARVGQFLAIGFMLLGLYGNFMLIFIGLFIFFAAGMEAGLEESKSKLSGYKVKHAVMKRYATLHPEETLAQAAQRLLENSDKNFVVMDQGNITGIISRSDILHGITDLGKNASVAKAMRRDYPILFADMPLEDAYETLISSAVTFAPVVDNENFFGVIDLDNINELLMIEKANREPRHTRAKPDKGITQRYLHI